MKMRFLVIFLCLVAPPVGTRSWRVRMQQHEGNTFFQSRKRNHNSVEKSDKSVNLNHSYTDGIATKKFCSGDGDKCDIEVKTEIQVKTEFEVKTEIGIPSIVNVFVKDSSAANSSASYNDVAKKLMMKMGYKEGKGLGKKEQGIVVPIEASKQKGKRGLGHIVLGITPSDVGWDFEKEQVTITESVEWLPPNSLPVPSLDELKNWKTEGRKKTTIEDEDTFCSKATLEGVLSSKSIFDNLEEEEMLKARTKSNPYETIRGAFFLNRAAMKMANMDSVLGYMFTNPTDKNGKSLVSPNELLYFADICAGPGGFSEYVLWRKNWDAKGFGFTLRGKNDFKLEDFCAASSELFEPHYGTGGLDGNGDIYEPANLLEFQKFVLSSTDNQGVHFVMADGGFSVDGQENIQEILSKRLYLCQFLCALMILRTGGHFVCKLFDLFTPFSVGLVYLMYRAFQKVAIFKPVTSRPANSERYIVCEGKRPDSLPVQEYFFFFYLNEQMKNIFLGNERSNIDITEVVPLSILKEDGAFFDYVYNSNEILGQQQMISLLKIKTFAQNTNLHEHRQSDIREKCLAAWNIPDKVRAAPDMAIKPNNRFQSLVQESEYQSTASILNANNPEDIIKSIYDYRCMVSGSKHRYLILSLGKCNIYKWDLDKPTRWVKIDDIKFEITRDSILDVEFVEELREGKGQRKVAAVHVFDVLFLGGMDVRNLHFNERIEKAKKFVRAISRTTRYDLAPIRVKEPVRFEQIEHIFAGLQMKVTKGGGHVRKVCYCCLEDGAKSRYIIPTGIHFIRTVASPWIMAMSKSQNRKYYYHTEKRMAVYETPKECIANYSECLKNRLVWHWDDSVQLHPEQKCSKPAANQLSKEILSQFLHSKLS